MGKKRNITKWDLVTELYEKNERNILQADIYSIVKDLLDLMEYKLVEGYDIELRGFGAFRRRVFGRRIGRNPNSPAKDIPVPAHNIIKFYPGKTLKNSVFEQDLPEGY